MAEFVIIVVIILATGPLTIRGLRFARKHRGMAHGAAALLLLFGVNASAVPPPPPRAEFVQRAEEEAEDDEPR
ncbi:hypothetical protein [Brevundimonas sp.]|uniref:hypothetical protein n=1 Tax=Brevundimonas sp. TaxID=1871086 RepID=UPI0025BFD249|nr:hypothetical protein [Brevundimonas sp.]